MFTEPWSLRKKRSSPNCHYVHYAMVMSKKYEVSFHHYTHYVVIHRKKINFSFCLETIATTFTKQVIAIIFSFQYYIHHVVTNVFSTYCYYVHYAMILKKKILFLLLLLRSIRHNYDKKTNYFSFQHYFHYTIIIRIKYCFIIAPTFTTP